MFNNCNPNLNGEELFYLKIKDNIKVIFDVGCRSDSLFNTFQGDVHYFEPVKEFIDELIKQPNNNKNFFYNNFGLGNEDNILFYYPNYQSFFNRTISCKVSDENNKILLKIVKSKNYVIQNNVQNIDFLKIDTEGFEFNVLKGFEEQLHNVKIIQFEYGGTFLDNNVKLIDVIKYLHDSGFHKFGYLTNYGVEPIKDFNDHYKYCNIVCLNKNSDYNPY
jgi:FkbM family methyltransferase